MANICKCERCGERGTVKLDLFRRGGRAVYLCNECANTLEGYTTENTTRHGTHKAHGFTYGMELETSYSTLKARAEILANRFIPTSDCTVDVEYKSPIMEGLNSLSKQLKTYDRLIESGDLRIDYSCGTHFHVGHREHINFTTISYVRRFYHSLFIPLSDEMKAHPDETKALFGRNFDECAWARPVDESTDATDHRNFINTEHSYSLEFRLCKFVNARQYMACVKLCAAIADCVVSNFIVHFNDEPKDRTRYPNQTAYRKHKAQVTAQKLVKLYRKAAGIA